MASEKPSPSASQRAAEVGSGALGAAAEVVGVEATGGVPGRGPGAELGGELEEAEVVGVGCVGDHGGTRERGIMCTNVNHA